MGLCLGFGCGSGVMLGFGSGSGGCVLGFRLACAWVVAFGCENEMGLGRKCLLAQVGFACCLVPSVGSGLLARFAMAVLVTKGACEVCVGFVREKCFSWFASAWNGLCEEEGLRGRCFLVSSFPCLCMTKFPSPCVFHSHSSLLSYGPLVQAGLPALFLGFSTIEDKSNGKLVLG